MYPQKYSLAHSLLRINHLRSWHEDISGHFGNRDANGQDINGKDPVPSICKTDKVTLPWRTLDFVTDNVD